MANVLDIGFFCSENQRAGHAHGHYIILLQRMFLSSFKTFFFIAYYFSLAAWIMSSCLFKALQRTVKDFYGLLVSFEPLLVEVEVSGLWRPETDSGGSPVTPLLCWAMERRSLWAAVNCGEFRKTIISTQSHTWPPDVWLAIETATSLSLFLSVTFSCSHMPPPSSSNLIICLLFSCGLLFIKMASAL